MKTEDLIQKLSIDLMPTKPMLSPLRMTAIFSSIGVALIGMSFFMMSLRIDLKEQLSDPKFFFEIGISFLLALAALALSTFLSRPGHENRTKNLEKLTVGFLVLVLVHDGFRVAQLTQSQIYLGLNLSGIQCFASVLGYSIMLGAAMMFWLCKGASTNPRLSGLVIGTACVAMGNVSITFFCGIENGMHIFIWHFIFPMLAAVVLGVTTSRFLLKW